MSKAELQGYFDQFVNPNHEHYQDYLWWNEKVNQYLQEL